MARAATLNPLGLSRARFTLRFQSDGPKKGFELCTNGRLLEHLRRQVRKHMSHYYARQAASPRRVIA